MIRVGPIVCQVFSLPLIHLVTSTVKSRSHHNAFPVQRYFVCKPVLCKLRNSRCISPPIIGIDDFVMCIPVTPRSSRQSKTTSGGAWNFLFFCIVFMTQLKSTLAFAKMPLYLETNYFFFFSISAIPHLGQLPSLSCATSGCIEQV